MSAQNLWDLSLRKGVLKTGHFELSSGRHSNVYFDKDAMYCDPLLYAMVIKGMEFLATKVGVSNFDVVTAPAVAGIALAAPVALYLGKIFTYPEKEMHKFVNPGQRGGVPRMGFRTPYQRVIPGKRVLILEDIVTTGASVLQVKTAVEKVGGEVVRVCCMWNRGGGAVYGGRIDSLLKETLAEDWPAPCPLCDIGVTLENPK